VSVSGSKLYTAGEIVKAGKITQSTNLIVLSEEKLTEKIRSSLPFVDGVKLDKKLPHTLTIKVTDATEDICYSYKNKYYTVSKKNYVLKSYNELPEGMVEIKSGKIECVPGQKIKIYDESAKKTCDKIFEVFESTNVKINSVDTTDALNINMKIEDRFEVKLGGNSNMENKCKHLLAMIKNIEDDAEGVINLSMWTPDKKEGTFIRNNPQ
jgi:cell division septal protein FtsQ